MYYIKKHDRNSVIKKKSDMLSKGVGLGLENNAVISSALRNGHINGESERQEEKMREYFFHSSMRELCLSKGDERNGKVKGNSSKAQCKEVCKERLRDP